MKQARGGGREEEEVVEEGGREEEEEEEEEEVPRSGSPQVLLQQVSLTQDSVRRRACVAG